MGRRFLIIVLIVHVLLFQVEVLEAEVSALKSLVITSTPSMPNRHLHPQLEPPPPLHPHSSATPAAAAAGAGKKSSGGFIKGHRRSTSHHNISREISLSEFQVPAHTHHHHHVPPAAFLNRQFDRKVQQFISSQYSFHDFLFILILSSKVETYI